MKIKPKIVIEVEIEATPLRINTVKIWRSIKFPENSTSRRKFHFNEVVFFVSYQLAYAITQQIFGSRNFANGILANVFDYLANGK